MQNYTLATSIADTKPKKKKKNYLITAKSL